VCTLLTVETFWFVLYFRVTHFLLVLKVTEKRNREMGVLLKLLVKVTSLHLTKDVYIIRCHR